MEGTRDLSTLFSLRSRKNKFDNGVLAASSGAKGKPVKGEVKRGGVGGRGADFDKD